MWRCSTRLLQQASGRICRFRVQRPVLLCTGVTAHRLADECVHITAAFQLCGCRQVVGTLWPVTDAAAEAVAEAFHARRAAASARRPSPDRRPRGPPRPLPRALTRWTAHVHTGVWSCAGVPPGRGTACRFGEHLAVPAVRGRIRDARDAPEGGR
ncbi:CHAT domain-containing protein [Streptomyces massasporeus]|uniref:CHAT domain-containing protein n=1 Tax=Streptomyces massasporeus TaxID=67324 RepID=UPI0033ED747F